MFGRSALIYALPTINAFDPSTYQYQLRSALACPQDFEDAHIAQAALIRRLNTIITHKTVLFKLVIVSGCPSLPQGSWIQGQGG